MTVVACLLIATPSEARERLKDGSTEAMMAEAVVRPLSLAGTVLGGAMYVITWPFAGQTLRSNLQAAARRFQALEGNQRGTLNGGYA